MEALQRPGRYKEIGRALAIKEVTVREGPTRQRFVVVRSREEAEHDRARREDIVREVERRLGELAPLDGAPHRKAVCELRAHPTYGRYVQQMETGKLKLNREKIRQEEQLDGRFLIRVSDDQLSAEDAVLGYKQLWQVEQAFRVLKTPLELRPIYHWTERRIRGHVMVCFLAFVLRQLLRTRLDKLGWQGSFTELLSGLGRVRATVLRGKGGQTFRLRDEIPAAAMPALHAVGMRAPRRLERLD